MHMDPPLAGRARLDHGHASAAEDIIPLLARWGHPHGAADADGDLAIGKREVVGAHGLDEARRDRLGSNGVGAWKKRDELVIAVTRDHVVVTPALPEAA